MSDQPQGLSIYWKIIKKGKVTIIGGTLFLMAATALVSFLLPPVYEASTIIEVGLLYPFPEQGVRKDPELIEEPMAVVAVLGSDEFLDAVRKELGLDVTLERLRKRLSVEQVVELTRFQRTESNLIRVTWEDNPPEICVAALNYLGKKLTGQHRRLYEVAIQAFSERKRGLEEQIAASREIIAAQRQYQAVMKERLAMVEDDTRNYESAIEKLDFGEADMNELLFFKAALSSLKEQLIKIETEINEAEVNIGEQEEIIREARIGIANLEGYIGLSRNTEIRTRPVIPEKPSKPDKALNVALAALLGLLITVSYVFLAHYVRPGE